MRAVIRLLKEKLASRWTPLVVALVAMALMLPALDVGWQLDDYYHRLVLGERFEIDGETVTLDIFRFGDGSPEQIKLFMDYGSLPWWTSPNWKAGFWRPIAAMTHWIDYQLWPATAEFMHAHSILWLGILILVVGRLYRRINGAVWIAGLATVLYAIDDAHGAATGWLANRNVIVATVFGAAALIAHARWRQTQWRPGAVVGPLFLVASLLAKESGIGVIAYLFSYALFLDKSAARDRILSLVPYLMIVLVWRVVWGYLGYGVSGTDLYTDPLHEPLRYAGLALIRFPLLLLGQWAGPPSEMAIFFSPAGLIKLTIAAVLVLTMLTFVLIPVLRRDRVARFWGTGMLLAIIPCAPIIPSDRLLFFVGIGAMGLLARFFAIVFDGGFKSATKRWLKIGVYSIAGILVLIHLLVPWAMLPLRANQPLGQTEEFNRFYFTPAADADLENKDVILVNAPSVLHALMSWSRAKAENLPLYQRVRILSSGWSSLVITRPDERSLVLSPEDGFLSGMFDDLFWTASLPMSKGDRVEIADLSIQVTEVTEDGRPLIVRFTFAKSLDDPSMYWLQFTEDGFIPFVPPAVGEGVVIPGVKPLF